MSGSNGTVAAASRWHVIAVALVLLCFVVAATTSMAQKSATLDESVYLTAGYSYFVTRDFHFNVEHPPLIKMLVALPLLALRLNPPAAVSDSSTGTRNPETTFVFNNTRPARSIVFWGRVPIVVLGTAIAAFVYWWTRRLAGPAAGFLALMLYAFDPNLLAHTQLATLDMGLAGCFVLAVYAVIRYLRQSTSRTLWGAGISFALAMLVKFTAILLVPIYALLCLIRNARRGAIAAGYTLGRLMLVMAAATVGLAFIAYAFQTGARDANWDLVRFFATHTGQSSIPVKAILKLSHVPQPAPEFWEGVSFQLEHSANQETNAYLNGQRYRGGRLDYLPEAFLVKTPVATLALAALAFAVFAYRLAPRTNAAPSFDEIAIVVAMIAFFGFSAVVRVNLGVRYLLPLYPLLFIFIALQVAWLQAAAARRKFLVSLSIVALLACAMVSSVRAYPHYLAYFNEPSGGSEHGWKLLADSNLDWGQDLPGVDAYLKQHGVKEVYLSYYGTAIPDAYGIRWSPLPTNQEVARNGPPPGLAAVSVSSLLLDLPSDSWVWKYQPIATIGHSIWIFDLRPAKRGR